MIKQNFIGETYEKYFAASRPPGKSINYQPPARRTFFLKILSTHRRDLYRWSPDAQTLMYISEADSNLWSYSLSDGATRQLTRLPGGSIGWFDWAREGDAAGSRSRLVLSRSLLSSDAVSLTDAGGAVK